MLRGESQGTNKVPLMIVGNKSDLRPDQRRITSAEGEELAQQWQCGFTEASARLDSNVTVAFEGMLGEIEKSQDPEHPSGGNKCQMM